MLAAGVEGRRQPLAGRERVLETQRPQLVRRALPF